MENFELFAKPFWVNLLVFVPFLLFYYWRKKKLSISRKILLYALIFGIAFGVIEASCVIYLRSSTGLLPGYEGTIFEVWKQAPQLNYDQTILERSLPMSLMIYELIREAATIIMLAMVAMIAATRLRERVAIFLWAFAVWDITYYAHLWLTIRWPDSLLSRDVLFLIPEAWISQVWYPILISVLTMLAVLINLKPEKHKDI